MIKIVNISWSQISVLKCFVTTWNISLEVFDTVKYVTSHNPCFFPGENSHTLTFRMLISRMLNLRVICTMKTESMGHLCKLQAEIRFDLCLWKHKSPLHHAFRDFFWSPLLQVGTCTLLVGTINLAVFSFMAIVLCPFKGWSRGHYQKLLLILLIENEYLICNIPSYLVW